MDELETAARLKREGVLCVLERDGNGFRVTVHPSQYPRLMEWPECCVAEVHEDGLRINTDKPLRLEISTAAPIGLGFESQL